jgi:hypothetical protein
MSGAPMLADSTSGPGRVPQGWYPDPLEPSELRWWTGERWTHDVQPRPAAMRFEHEMLVDARML